MQTSTPLAVRAAMLVLLFAAPVFSANATSIHPVGYSEYAPHHTDTGSPNHPSGSGDPTHYFAETEDAHHFAWTDSIPGTPGVIDVYYDFRGPAVIPI